MSAKSTHTPPQKSLRDASTACYFARSEVEFCKFCDHPPYRYAPGNRSASKVDSIYYFASSLDGFIADADGGVDWLTLYQNVDRGYSKFIRSIDGAVMGRKTYEQALALVKGGKWPLPKIPCAVLSTTRASGPHVGFWSKPLADLPAHFRNKGSRNVWVMGGGATAASFLEAGLLTVIPQGLLPFALGSGIPAYGPLQNHVALELLESKSFPNGVVSLCYKLK